MSQYHGIDPNGGGGYVNPWGNRYGVWGESNASEGVIGTSGSADGVWGATHGTLDSFGVFGMGGVGVAGSTTDGGSGVAGFSLNSTGVYGNDGGDGDGVSGKSSSGQGVYGESDTGSGLVGFSSQSDSVSGYKESFDGAAGSFVSLVFSGGPRTRLVQYGQAGTFWGHVDVVGNLMISGSKGFKIDHPLDPAGKFLYHSSIESPDMKNLYDGVAILDADGEAIIQLPAWFAALNKELRYQLTPLGAAAPGLHIAEEVRDNQFRIAGGGAKMKVCWQVTGTRQDAWAERHRMPIEEAKGKDTGRYLHPELYKDSSREDLQSVALLHAARRLHGFKTVKAAAARRKKALEKSTKRITTERKRFAKKSAKGRGRR